jgi:hypothetical protein
MESMKELKDIISDIDESVLKILSNDFNLLTNVNLEPDILIRRNLLKCNDKIFSKIENCTSIVYPNGATCLPVNCCFSELVI